MRELAFAVADRPPLPDLEVMRFSHREHRRRRQPPGRAGGDLVAGFIFA
jgi:hypothetical protein